MILNVRMFRTSQDKGKTLQTDQATPKAIITETLSMTSDVENSSRIRGTSIYLC